MISDIYTAPEKEEVFWSSKTKPQTADQLVQTTFLTTP